MTADEPSAVAVLLASLPDRGWAVVRDPDMISLTAAALAGMVRAHRSGPGEGVYEVRITGYGRDFLRTYQPPFGEALPACRTVSLGPIDSESCEEEVNA